MSGIGRGMLGKVKSTILHKRV